MGSPSPYSVFTTCRFFKPSPFGSMAHDLSVQPFYSYMHIHACVDACEKFKSFQRGISMQPKNGKTHNTK